MKVALETLGGIVKSRKRAYRVEVKSQAAKGPVKLGKVEFDRFFDINVYDNETEALVRADGFMMKPEESLEDFEPLVEWIKRSASKDFA
jgi:hypothetical protein